VAPFLYMLTTSVKSLGSVIAGRMWPWPPMGDEAVQWGNYLEAIRRTGWDKDWGMFLFYRYAINSIIVTLPPSSACWSPRSWPRTRWRR